MIAYTNVWTTMLLSHKKIAEQIIKHAGEVEEDKNPDAQSWDEFYRRAETLRDRLKTEERKYSTTMAKTAIKVAKKARRMQ